MINFQRIFKNSLFITTGLLADGFILFLVFVLNARYLGVEEFGSFVFIVTIINVFQIFANGGMVNITIREIARTKEQTQNILSATLTLAMLILSGLFIIIYLGMVFFQPYPHLQTTIYMLGIAALVTVHATIHAAVLRAYENMGRVAVTALTHKLSLLAFVFIAIRFDLGMEGIAFAYLLASLLNWLIFFALVRIFYTRTSWRIDLGYWKFLIKEALPLGIGLVLRRITIHTDTFLLAFLSTVTAVGLFNSAYRVTQMLEVAILALCGVLFPVFSRLAKQSPQEFQHLFSNSLRLFIILSTPLAIWLLLVSQELIIIVYGQAYREAGQVLAVLGVTLFFLMPGALFFSVFSALNRQRLFLLLTMVGFVVNVSLDILLIPFFDYLGAAIATFMTEATMFIGGAFLLYRLNIKADYLSIYIQTVLIIIIPSILLQLSVHANNYLLLSLATLLYLVIYFWLVIRFKLIQKSEWHFLRNLLNQRKNSSSCPS